MTPARTGLTLLLVCGLAACATEPPRRATLAEQDACRARADEVVLKQNPGERYRDDLYVSGQRDSPFGGTGVSDPTAGLGARFDRARLLDTCLRNVNAQPATAPAAAAKP
jgi:hypothetical protein